MGNSQKRIKGVTRMPLRLIEASLLDGMNDLWQPLHKEEAMRFPKLPKTFWDEAVQIILLGGIKFMISLISRQ
jgi:hypothetical protein